VSLKEVFARAWRTKRGLGDGWLVNLEPTYNLGLGAVGVVDGDDFRAETTLDRRGVTGLDPDPDQRRSATPWQFQSNDGISVTLSSLGATSGAVAAVGAASWELDVNFGSASGVSIHGTAMWWNGYADLGLVRAGIVDAARDERLHKGESIVVSQQLTGAGLLLLAEGHNASLKATASVDVAPGATPSIGSLSGALGVVHSSGGAQMQRFDDGSVLAGRVLYLGVRGWFWWRRFEAFGVGPVRPDDAEMAIMQPSEGDGDDEYFALV
jgi:hypothetical protein